MIKSDANKNESEKRKREEEQKERKLKMADETALKNRKVSKKKSKDSAAGKKLEERPSEEKKTKDEVLLEARREELIANGVTPMVLDDDKTGGSDDMEWESDQWKVVGHAVDWTTAKANYKVVTGMRSGETEAAQMWMWGQRSNLLRDGMDKSKLEAHIQEKCEHPIHREHLIRAVKKKLVAGEKPKKKKPCDHSSCDLGLSHHADPEVNPGWCAEGKFLFGVECAGCGSPFVQKAPPAREGGGKEGGDPQVPSTTNAACCCNNLRNRNGSSDEECSRACCKRCWDAGLLEASKGGGPRTSRRRRQSCCAFIAGVVSAVFALFVQKT